MLNLGLSPTEQRWFHDTLVSHHRVQVRVSLMDLEHRHLADLTHLLDDGQVDVDARGDVSTRSLSLTLVDPHRESTLDGATAGTVGVSQDRMIRVLYCVWVPPMDEWVSVPVFTGPVRDVAREAHTVTVECHGKEYLARRSGWRTRVWNRGLSRIGVIRSILTDMSGETKFDFPSVYPGSARLADTLTLTRRATPWVHAVKLANSMNWNLFYDGRGFARLRPRSLKRVVWEFRDGDGGSVLTEPKVTPDDPEGDGEGPPNTFEVLGVKSPNNQVRAVEYLPSWHARSPLNLGRGGRGGYVVQSVENEEIRDWGEARRIARQMRDDAMGDRGQVSWDGLVVPHLEALDRVGIDAGGITQQHYLLEFSIPLRGASASYGYRTSLKRRRRRTRR